MTHPGTDEDEIFPLSFILLLLEDDPQLILHPLGLDQLSDWKAARKIRAGMTREGSAPFLSHHPRRKPELCRGSRRGKTPGSDYGDPKAVGMGLV